MSGDNMSAIDRAIAAAKARSEQRAANGGVIPRKVAPTKSAKASGDSPEKAAKLAERAAAREAREASRAERAKLRAAARAAKAAERAAAKADRVPHMSKVDRAAEKLPGLSDTAAALFETLKGLESGDLTALLAHAAHFNRVRSTRAALSRTLNVGDVVKIVSGDPRYIGSVGVLSSVQRIRCYVELPDTDKLVYLFTSDVEPTGAVVEGLGGDPIAEDSNEDASAEVPATGTDG